MMMHCLRLELLHIYLNWKNISHCVNKKPQIHSSTVLFMHSLILTVASLQKRGIHTCQSHSSDECTCSWIKEKKEEEKWIQTKKEKLYCGFYSFAMLDIESVINFQYYVFVY